MIVLEASIKGKKKRKYLFYGKEIPNKKKFIWFFESLYSRERSKTEKLIIEKIIKELSSSNFDSSNFDSSNLDINSDIKIEIYVIIPNKL